MHMLPWVHQCPSLPPSLPSLPPSPLPPSFPPGVIESSASNRQVLDHLPVERERGITVKAQTATMFHSHAGEEYMLNLIDTPVS